MRIVLRPRAHRDLFDACAWYEAQQPGLGVEIKQCVYECMDRIQEAPSAHPVLFGDFRSGTVRRFSSYRVIYEIVDDTIVVHTIHHTSRNPKELKRILRRRKS
jgi:hypothetical protein